MLHPARVMLNGGNLKQNAVEGLAIETLSLRFGNDDYYYVYDYEGFSIVHGTRPEREGKNFYTAVDPAGKQFVDLERARRVLIEEGG